MKVFIFIGCKVGNIRHIFQWALLLNNCDTFFLHIANYGFVCSIFDRKLLHFVYYCFRIEVSLEVGFVYLGNRWHEWDATRR